HAATSGSHTLALHDALPISHASISARTVQARSVQAASGPVRPLLDQKVCEAASLVATQALFGDCELGKFTVGLIRHAPFSTVIHQFDAASMHDIAVGKAIPVCW